MNMLRRIALWIGALMLLLSSAGAESTVPEGLERFEVRHGSRSSRQIAITMDDAFEREWVWKTAELCREYGIRMTFFPIGVNLHEEEGEQWRALGEDGFEIGSHSNRHEDYHDIPERLATGRLGMFQENLDRVLGYHYQVRWFRPPFGRIADENKDQEPMRRVIIRYGYEHSLRWDVSQTDPAIAVTQVKNGSILLYHARHKDYECLKILIPQLLEKGFEPVTVSRLFGYPDPEYGGEPYHYSWDNYKR